MSKFANWFDGYDSRVPMFLLDAMESAWNAALDEAEKTCNEMDDGAHPKHYAAEMWKLRTTARGNGAVMKGEG